MRRKRRKVRNGVFIDLTSLLDIIFIFLMLFICSYHLEKQKNATSREATEKAKADAEAVSQDYADMIDTYKNLNQYVGAASISVPYDPNDITKRTIKVLTEDAEIKSIDLVGNDAAGNIDEFKDYIKGYINEHEGRPIILSLNEEDDKILYRDEKSINEIFGELLKTYPNVYIKGSISEE